MTEVEAARSYSVLLSKCLLDLGVKAVPTYDENSYRREWCEVRGAIKSQMEGLGWPLQGSPMQATLPQSN